ncbi:hypothetical protein CF327_g4332 [Tilletia walkeri]|nr:hypothetical protein CF327_g4332 [Tilletia walkeri]
MVGLGNLLAQPCSLCLHFASQDVLVYPAPHEDLPSDPNQQAPPPGPDTTLSGVVEVFSPTDRTISAIRIVLRNAQTLAIPDVSPPSGGGPVATLRYEEASTFSRTIEITAEHHGSNSHNAKQLSRSSKASAAAAASSAEAQLQPSSSGSGSLSNNTHASSPGHSETAGIYLPRGSSFFSFTFILPATLAPTHRSKNGRLRYYCTAVAIGGGRARSNISSSPREIFVMALPQPESLASSGQTRATLINQAEGFNAPGMPAPIPLDVQFHDFHDPLGILSISLTSLSLTVGSIATLSIYHPAPPPFLNVHLIRVTLEQTAEVYNRLRRGWMRFPVEKYRLWEAGFMPFKKAEDQPIRPRRLGTVTTALADQFLMDPGTTRTWPVEAGPLRRATEWEDSIWVASADGSKGHPGNALLDRLYVNPADAAVAAASAAQEHLKQNESELTAGEGFTAESRRPDTSSSHYFASRPSSPVHGHSGKKTRSVPTTPGSHMNTPSLLRSAQGPAQSDPRPHPNPLYATACDNPSLPYLSAISGAWVDRPVPPTSTPSTSSLPSEGPNAYRLRALLRLPSDDILHPTTLRGTRSDVHHTHEAVIEVFFSRSNVLSEEKGKEGRPKVQVFSMRKNVVIQSCVVTPDMIHLPPYGGHEREGDSGSGVGTSATGVGAGGGGSGSGEGGTGDDAAAGLPTYTDATSTPSTRPPSPHSMANVEMRASSPSIAIAGPSNPISSGTPMHAPAPTQRGRPGFLRRVTSPNVSGEGSTTNIDSGNRNADTSVAPQSHSQSHSHLRNTLSSILHPHSHSHSHHATQSHRNTASGGMSMFKRSGHSGSAAEVHMSTATAPPSRAPSRAASRESSPTRSSGRQTPPAFHSSAQLTVSPGGSHGDGSAEGSSSSANQLAKQPQQPQQPQHHHPRRNGFAFGFTPSSARRGEGEDSDVHHQAQAQAQAHAQRSGPASSNERHAHFIPAQVVGRERGRTAASSGTASPSSNTALSLSQSPSSNVALALGAGNSNPLGTGSGGSGSSSTGNLSRRASGQLGLGGGSGGELAMSASPNVGMSGAAPAPARLANALRMLQLSQAQAAGTGVVATAIGGDVGSPSSNIQANSYNPSTSVPIAGSALSNPASGTNTPGGTLVTSGPNLPSEWNLVMAPGERTSTTHSTCMCGRTTESLLRAERLLLVGVPTAPYFTPSPGPTPSLSQRSSFVAGPSGTDFSAAAAQAGDHYHLHHSQHHLLPTPDREHIHDLLSPGEALSSMHLLSTHSASPIPTPPMQRSLSFSAVPTPNSNVGADDPEGVLWSVGMRADGRLGRRPEGGGEDNAFSMRRSQSALGPSERRADHDAEKELLQRREGDLIQVGDSSSSTAFHNVVSTPVPVDQHSQQQQHPPAPAGLSVNSSSLLGLDEGRGLLEDLLEPTDEFVLARGRDPDEILRRKDELMARQGPA